jgi:hypothetical protein
MHRGDFLPRIGVSRNRSYLEMGMEGKQAKEFAPCIATSSYDTDFHAGIIA